MISDSIELDASEAIDAAKAYGDALASAAEKLTALQEKSAAFDVGGGAADKFAASWSSAIAKVRADLDSLGSSAAKLDSLGSGAAGAADGLKGVGDAATGAASGLKAAGDSAAGAADGLKGLGDTAKGAADGLKGVGDSALGAGDGIKGLGDSVKASEAFLAEYNATMAETAAMQREVAAASADASAKIALGQRLNTAAARDASADAIATQKTQAKTAAAAAADAEATARRYHMLALGGAAALGYGVYKAAQLQTGVTRLYTSAGVPKSQLPAISQGILSLSGQTNTSQDQLAQGAYMIGSAGFTKSDQLLAILKSAAQGAQAEGAPLGETGNALTSLLNAYGLKKGVPVQSQATSAMNQIISMVAHGKMTMASAVTALPAMLPVAANAGLSFGQAGGALATMTATGMSPDQAAQNIRHAITAIQKPSGIQAAEMQMLGINPNQLSKDLGKQGLTGTIQEVDAAIQKHMGPGGMVMIDTMNQAKLATQSAHEEIAAMPDSIQGVAKAYLSGSINAKQFNQEVRQGGESARDANLLKQFQTTAGTALGFSSLVKSGLGNKQTQAAALNALMGGQVGQQVALELGGGHLGKFKANVDAVGDSAKKAGNNVQGWSEVTKTLNFQIGSFTKQAEAVATQAGQVLLPTVTTVMKGLSTVGGFLASHPAVTKPLVEGGALLGAAAIAPKVASAGATALGSIGKVAETLHIPGLDKLANLGKGSAAGTMADAAAGNQRAADTMAEAAAGFQRAADTMVGSDLGKPGGGGGLPGGAKTTAERDAARTAEGDAARTAEKDAPGLLSKFGKVLPAVGGLLGGPVGWGTLIATQVVDPLLKSMKSGPGGRNWLDNPFGMPGPNDKASANNWLTSFSPYERLFNRGKGPASAAPSFTGRFGPIAAPAAAPTAPAPAAGPMLSLGGHPAAATAKITADVSGIEQAKGKVQAAMGGIDQILKGFHPAKLPAPDLSALDSAKGKAKADGQAISDGVGDAIKKPVKAAQPDISAYRAAIGPARTDGAQISAGLASGIESGKGAVVAAATDVGNAAAAAMAKAAATASPSKKTIKIGQDTAQGMVVGLEGGKAAVDAAATAIGKSATKAADITSIDSTIAKLKKDVPGDSGLVKWLTGQQSKLTQLANRRTALEAQITDAQNIAKQAIANADITQAGTYQSALTTAGGPLAASATISGMQAQAADAKQFAQVIGQLKKEGLNATSLNQITQAGPSALPMAQGLAQGGKAAIQQVNQLEGQIRGSAAKLGNIGAGPMYQAGIQVTQGLAQGIKAGLSSVDSAIRQLAQQVVNDVKKDLKSHSPAEVMIPPGMSIPQGVAAGIDRGTGSATAAMGRMSRSLQMAPYHPQTAYAHPAAGGSSAGGGGGDTHIHVNTTVQGSLLAQNDFESHVQETLNQLAQRNWQGGVKLPGRAS